jgi:DNA polymerase III, gamma/tau subunits
MFDQLIGNQAVKDAIGRFISNRRVPNSLLFAGPEGVGKKQFALQLARAIVCHEPQNGDACEECLACKRVNEFKFPGADAKGDDHDFVFFSEHPDVGMVVPFNRTLRVGSIRALETEANFRPYEAPARIFIIDNAHRMNPASSNALLKTLEEPPSTSHIFLVTSKPNALLPTIRSRVQTLRFGPVAASELEHHLLVTHDYSQADARLIASTSNGSVAQALSVNAEEFRSRRNEAFEILRSAIVNHDLVDILKRSEKFGATKSTPEFEAFLGVLQTMIHDIWLTRTGSTGVPVDDEVTRLAEFADPKELASWLEHIEEIRAALSGKYQQKDRRRFIACADGRINRNKSQK